MTDDADATREHQRWGSPPPSAEEIDEQVVDARTLLYELTGEAVSVAAAGEATIRKLASAFGGGSEGSFLRCWKEEVKPALARFGLTDSLQREMEDVAKLVAARNAAAHEARLFITAGDTTEIACYKFGDGGDLETSIIDFADLEQRVDEARDGRRALKLIGQALDVADPSVLAGEGTLVRALLFNLD